MHKLIVDLSANFFLSQKEHASRYSRHSLQSQRGKQTIMMKFSIHSKLFNSWGFEKLRVGEMTKWMHSNLMTSDNSSKFSTALTNNRLLWITIAGSVKKKTHTHLSVNWIRLVENRNSNEQGISRKKTSYSHDKTSNIFVTFCVKYENKRCQLRIVVDRIVYFYFMHITKRHLIPKTVVIMEAP